MRGCTICKRQRTLLRLVIALQFELMCEPWLDVVDEWCSVVEHVLYLCITRCCMLHIIGVSEPLAHARITRGFLIDRARPRFRLGSESTEIMSTTDMAQTDNRTGAFRPTRNRASLGALPSSSSASSSNLKENAHSTSTTAKTSLAQRKKRAQSLGGDATPQLMKASLSVLELSPGQQRRRKAVSS